MKCSYLKRSSSSSKVMQRCRPKAGLKMSDGPERSLAWSAETRQNREPVHAKRFYDCFAVIVLENVMVQKAYIKTEPP